VLGDDTAVHDIGPDVPGTLRRDRHGDREEHRGRAKDSATTQTWPPPLQREDEPEGGDRDGEDRQLQAGARDRTERKRRRGGDDGNDEGAD
jgi:hypothetical protein